LRRAAPVWWVAQRRGSAGFDDEGYWAVTRHADILAVSKTPDVYSSWENTALIRFTEGMPRESIELQRYILLNIDPPEHTKLRGIVSRGFTPRAIGSLRDALTARAEHIGGPAGRPVLPVGQLRRGGVHPPRAVRHSPGPEPPPRLRRYGTHYCLGANLAKLEIELIFTAIADAMADIAKAGDPVRLRSGWINGIKTLPVSYRG
jgi:cytochrome P450